MANIRYAKLHGTTHRPWTDGNTAKFDFGEAEGCRIEARFDGGTLTSNAGAPLLGKVEASPSKTPSALTNPPQRLLRCGLANNLEQIPRLPGTRALCHIDGGRKGLEIGDRQSVEPRPLSLAAVRQEMEPHFVEKIRNEAVAIGAPIFADDLFDATRRRQLDQLVHPKNRS
nr:transposase [Methylosinus sp. Sm6]